MLNKNLEFLQNLITSRFPNFDKFSLKFVAMVIYTKNVNYTPYSFFI